jgi:hypothetical protein
MQNRHDRRVHRIFSRFALAPPVNVDCTERRTVLLRGKYLYAVRDYCPATVPRAASIRVLPVPVLGMGVSLPSMAQAGVRSGREPWASSSARSPSGSTVWLPLRTGGVDLPRTAGAVARRRPSAVSGKPSRGFGHDRQAALFTDNEELNTDALLRLAHRGSRPRTIALFDHPNERAEHPLRTTAPEAIPPVGAIGSAQVQPPSYRRNGRVPTPRRDDAT